jgi:hypothetical protein
MASVSPIDLFTSELSTNNFTQAPRVSVNPECLVAFENLKLKAQYSYILYGLSRNGTEIIVRKTSEYQDHDNLLSDLPETECQWVVYDFRYNTERGPKKKIILLSWYVPLPQPILFCMVMVRELD